MLSSRAVKVAVLFSLEEIQGLFQRFSDLVLYNTASVCEPKDTVIPLSDFYDAYGKYLEKSKNKEEYVSPFLTSAMSVDPDAITAMDVGQGRVLLRPKKPLIQIRPYHFSSQGGRIVPMSFQKDKTFWGLEFSYPQIFAPSRDAPIQRVWRHPDFPNSILFVEMMKWIYRESVLHPPSRIGKKMHAY